MAVNEGVEGWGMYETEEKCIKNFGRKNLKEGDRLEDLDVDGQVTLKFMS
jgi:hypothetical protein